MNKLNPPNTIRDSILAAAMTMAAASASLADWKANLPDPISNASKYNEPYKYVGLLTKGGGCCSASVVKHKRVLLTAAHCIYGADGTPNELSRWFHRYTGEGIPDIDTGTELYGHRRFNAYVNYLQGGGEKNDKEAFNWDIASLFGFENMANGGTAPYHSNGKSLLKSITKDKRVVGYPYRLYSDDPDSPRPTPAYADDKYKMHTSSPASHRFWKKSGTDHYYRATGQAKSLAKIISIGGNSGGPLFVKDDGTWKVSGVVVSSQNDYKLSDDPEKYSGRAGVRALNSNAISELLDPLSNAGDCNYSLNPASRWHSHAGGAGSVGVSVGAGCQWVVSTSPADGQWIHPEAPSGQGNGTLNYTVEPNPLVTTRIGKINIHGKYFTIQQLGNETVDLRDRGSSWRSLSHTERAPGQKLTINADVYNGGNSPSGSGFKVRYYASRNKIINPWIDAYLGQKTLGALDNNKWASADKQVTIPAELDGSYYIGWKIDSSNQVSEVDEGNNVVWMNEPIFVKRIDLRDGGDHESIYNDVHPGHAVRFKGKVANDGNADSGAFEMKFFLSKVEGGLGLVFNGNGGEPPAPQIVPGDIYIGKRSFSVNKASSKAFDFPIVLATNILQGTYRVKWAIDASNGIHETNEDNNVVQMGSPVVKILSTIDLRDRGPQYKGLSATERKAGQSLTIVGDVFNGGNLGSGPYKVAFYASNDGVIDPDQDIKLGEKSMPGLFKGNHDDVDHTVQIPMTMAAGTYTIGWVIDPYGTATQNQGVVLVGNGGGAQAPKIELTNNNKVVVGTPLLKISALSLVLNPGGGGGFDGPGDLAPPPIDPDPGFNGPGDLAPPSQPDDTEIAITSIRIQDGKVLIEFPSRAGFNYTLKGSPDMQDWSTIISEQGTGLPLVLKDPHNTSQKFYRVRGDKDGKKLPLSRK